jgi:hypothetical protein
MRPRPAPVTDADVDALRQRFTDAQAHGRITITPPLPRRVRARLWVTSRINQFGCWLVEHHHEGAAVTLWRACRMW